MRSGLLGAAVVVATIVAAQPAVVAQPAVAVPHTGHVRASLIDLKGANNGGRLSPNGDGRHDRVGVSYHLHRKARVTALVLTRTKKARVVRRVALGMQRPGDRTWRWDGRTDRHRVVPDARYRVRLVAVSTGRRPVRRAVTVGVWSLTHSYLYQLRRDWDVVGLKVSRDSVYPDTTAVTDGVAVQELPVVYFGFGGPSGAIVDRPAIKVTSAAGRVVATVATQVTTGVGDADGIWRGTDDAGARLPDGQYKISATWQDPFGIRVTTARPVAIRSGSLHLVELSIKTSPVAARVSNGYTCDDAGPQLCISHAGSTPSSQFAGGLTFAAQSYSQFEAALPWAADPVHDQFRITYTGAPTSAGDTASDTAGALFASSEVRATTTAGGTTTTGWGRNRDWLPEGDLDTSPQLFWRFTNDAAGTSYDLGSFAIDVRHWAPPAT